MAASSVRVLVVDDYEPWRRFVSTTLQKQPGLQVSGEASDGLEAVQKAEELQPDLIVLDIGLPTLTGIEAARRIRKVSPKSKILFISQESSADVVQEALASGALGYVVKVHAGSDLLPAVGAVLEGRQFVSSGSRNDAPPSLALGKVETPRSHKVAFYSDDAALVVGFSRFIEAALEAGNAVIVIATESHRDLLLLRLQEDGVDVAAALGQRRYVSFDVTETLSIFMVNDLPDPAQCLKVARDLVIDATKAAKGVPPRVAVCVECAPSLWAQRKADAAVQVEHLWDEIARTHEVDILCGYVLNSFQREQESHIYERICAEHSAVSSR